MRTVILLLATFALEARADEPTAAPVPPPPTSPPPASAATGALGVAGQVPNAPPPATVTVAVPPALVVGTTCKQAALGTAKEYERILDGMRAAGATHFLVVGDGLLCGWP